MSKTSVMYKTIVFTILITLLMASIPMTSVIAKGNNGDLESKWDQLVTNYDRQNSTHSSVHRWADQWLSTHKKASVSDKNEVAKHLTICNSAITAAGAIISKHAGFDTKGNVIERASALQSIDTLSYFLQQHAGSVKNLKEHINR